MSEPESAVARARAWLRQQWAAGPPVLRRHWPWFSLGVVVASALIVFALRAAFMGPKDDEAPAAANAPAAASEEGSAPGDPEAVHPPEAVGANSVDAGAPLSPNVKVTFKTYPLRRASVMWGSKRLGFIDRGKPLVVERVRDSGPLDVVIRAQGYLPVHARAYTFNDATVEVRITPIDKKDTIYGYQQPLVDAGAPL